MEGAAAAPAAIALLLDEHAAGQAVFTALERALGEAVIGDAPGVAGALSAVRAGLLYLETALELHIAREEGPLFPRLKAALPADDRLIDEMIAEHDLIRIKRDGLLDAISRLLDAHDDLRGDREQLRLLLDAATPPGLSQHALDALRQAAATVISKLRVHFENEEELVFPLAPALLTPAALDAVAAEMADLDHVAT